MSLPVAPGDVVADKYRVVRELGRGGMGVVYAADHLQLPQQVAIKFLLGGANPAATVRFEREAKTVVRMRSEHVCRVLDVGSLPSGEPFIVMELLEGKDLADHVLEQGPLTIADAIDYVLQACEALMEAHSLGVVHRDLKPSNLFLSQRVDGSGIVKVLDFGISKTDDATDHRELTQSGAMLGSPRFMAPEQLVSAKQVTAQTDVWALGVVLHELLTGAAAFDGATPAELFVAILQHPPASLNEQRPDLPAGIVQAVAGALEKESEDRYPNIAAFALALAPYAPPHARPLVDRVVRMGAATGWSPPAHTGQTTQPSGTKLDGGPRSTAKGTIKMAAVAVDPASSPHADTMQGTPSTTSPPQTGPAVVPPAASPRAVITPAESIGAVATVSSDPAPSPPSRPPTAAPGITADPPQAPSTPRGSGRGGVWIGLSLGLLVAIVAVAGVVWATRNTPTATEDEDRDERKKKKKRRKRDEDEEAPTTPGPLPCTFEFCDNEFRLDTKGPANAAAPLDTIRRKIESKLRVNAPELVLVSASGIVEGKFHPRTGSINYGFRYEGPDGEYEMAQAILTPWQLSLRRTPSVGQPPLDLPKCSLAKALDRAYDDGFPRDEGAVGLAYLNGTNVFWQLSTTKSGKVRFVDGDCQPSQTITPTSPP